MNTTRLNATGYFVACRAGADGYVYAYATTTNDLTDAVEIGRIRQVSCYHDKQLWIDFKKACADHLTRWVASCEGRKAAEYVQLEEKPPGGTA